MTRENTCERSASSLTFLRVTDKARSPFKNREGAQAGHGFPTDGNRLRPFDEAAIDDERVELVSQVARLAEVAAGGNAPVDVGLAALPFLDDANVDPL